MNLPPLLSIIIFMPLICAFMVGMVHGEKGDELVVEKNIKHLSFFGSVFVFAFALFMYSRFNPDEVGFQFVEKHDWFGDMGISYHVGIDGISIYFILLTAFLTPICILASWNSIKTRLKEYMIAFLVLESFMIGAFAALDGVLFYIFFEGVLLPMFFIIGIWGGERRVHASYKLFLYNLLGSLLLLLALLVLCIQSGTSDMTVMIAHPVDLALQKWLWLALFVSFAIKVPIWPFHTWLPDIHAETSTAGSVIMAGVLLKMGGYGFLRFSLPMMPAASLYFAPFVMMLSAIAIMYASLVALVQEDMKKFVAYSSVANMGFVTLGIFSFTAQGIDGAIFQMLSHGLIFAALFLCVGVLYDRSRTCSVGEFGGIVKSMPKFSVMLMIFVLAAIGLPGTSGFIGEFLSLLGAYSANSYATVFASIGVILGAACMLQFYRRIVFSSQDNRDSHKMIGLNTYEMATIIPLVILILYLGFFPNAVLNKISPATVNIVNIYKSLDSGTSVTNVIKFEQEAVE